MSAASGTSGPHSVIAFDFGRRRIGVAVGNSLTASAQTLPIIEQTNPAQRWLAIASVIGEWQPTMLVVGRPLHPDGTAHEMTSACERFARQLEGRFGIKVAQVDERYSSREARSDVASERTGGAGSRRAGETRPGKIGANRSGAAAVAVDSVAAAIILRQYWNSSAAPAAPRPAENDH